MPQTEEYPSSMAKSEKRQKSRFSEEQMTTVTNSGNGQEGCFTKEFTPAVIKLKDRRRSRLSTEVLPFDMGYLPPHFQKKAERNLNETAENMQKGIRLLREMAKKDKNFDGQILDDGFLVQFLRFRKYDVAKAFSRLKNCIILKKKLSDCFTDIKFEKISIAMRNNIVTFLPRRCHDGCAIWHVKLDRWDPKLFPFEEVKRSVLVLVTQSLRDPMTQVNGYKIIVNMKSNPIKHLRYFTSSNIYLMYHGSQDCMPANLKEIHIVNNTPTFRLAYMLMKPFMSQKQRERFVIHSHPETLTDYFNPSVLPREYGGHLDELDMTDWLRKVTQPDQLATIGGGPSHMSKRRPSRV